MHDSRDFFDPDDVSDRERFFPEQEQAADDVSQRVPGRDTHGDADDPRRAEQGGEIDSEFGQDHDEQNGVSEIDDSLAHEHVGLLRHAFIGRAPENENKEPDQQGPYDEIQQDDQEFRAEGRSGKITEIQAVQKIQVHVTSRKWF
jgi:hypothetical protein